MLEKFHKGQLGRVAVIGGSADNTGAPYFSAMASARLGCDLSYVFCEPSAAPTIKSYSPNLMVSPILRSLASISQTQKDSEPSGKELAKPIIDMLPRLHVLVIGPGLGRDEITQKQVKAVIQAARNYDPPVPMVLDADALWLVQTDPDIIKGYKECILTPNVVEFGRLAKSLGMDHNKGRPRESVSGAGWHFRWSVHHSERARRLHLSRQRDDSFRFQGRPKEVWGSRRYSDWVSWHFPWVAPGLP